MKIDSGSGLVDTARQVPSPNRDNRPDPADIGLLVIHGISLPPGEFGGCWIEDLFCNTLDINAHPYFAELEGLEVSSHFLIRRNGELLQFVPTTQRAWHAGDSEYCGRSRCNDFSIGIELEGCDDEPYEEAQYHRLAELTRTLMQAYPGITIDRIAGHSDIAPGRKTDPGPAFDWQKYKALIKA